MLALGGSVLISDQRASHTDGLFENESEHLLGSSENQDETSPEATFRFPRIEESPFFSPIETEHLPFRLPDRKDGVARLQPPRRPLTRSPGKPRRPLASQEADIENVTPKFVMQMVVAGLLLLAFVLLKTEHPSGATRIESIAGHVVRQDSLIPTVTTWYNAEVATRLKLPFAGNTPFRFVKPIAGKVAVDYNSRNQQEMILEGSPGEAVHAAADGKVEKIGKSAQQGNYIIVSHNENQETIYAHLGAVAAKAGESVKQGAIVGYLTLTGKNVMYFGYRVNNAFADPHSIISFAVQ